MTATRKDDCSTPQTVLHMVLELSEKTWKLGFTTGLGQEPRLRDMPARAVVALEQEIKAAKERLGLPPETPVVSCYEAGRDGFWLHRCLVSLGVANVVGTRSGLRTAASVCGGSASWPWRGNCWWRCGGIWKPGFRRTAPSWRIGGASCIIRPIWRSRAEC